MAGRHIKDLIAGYNRRDDALFRSAVEGIIDEEEAKHHTALARDLRNALGAAPSGAAPLLVPPLDRDSGTPLARVVNPEARTTPLVFDEQVQRVLTRFADEVEKWPELDAEGLPRRNRVLLYGPPGCGKTSAVKDLAARLGRPLVIARIESLVSSYLGETASNLNKLFDFVSEGPYVLLLDEFDSLGKLRNDPTDHGELRRVVNTVLQLIDAYSGPSIIVAATNHPEILDAALWRRFDVVAELPLPTAEQHQQILTELLKGRGSFKELAAVGETLASVNLPHAAAEFTAHMAIREALLDGADAVDDLRLFNAAHSAAARRWA